MTDATKQSAISLLERLRTLAETWPHADPPWLGTVLEIGARIRMTASQPPEWRRAVAALMAVNYYDARDKTAWLARLGEAIESLKGATT